MIRNYIDDADIYYIEGHVTKRNETSECVCELAGLAQLVHRLDNGLDGFDDAVDAYSQDTFVHALEVANKLRILC